ncbi:MAG: thioredoxin family protein [Planctomycetota bacterium]|jgi:thioredoxin-related protein
MDDQPEATMETMPDDLNGPLEAATVPRRRRSSLRKPAIIAILIVGLYYTVTWSSPSFENWEVSYDDAVAKATSSNRNILAAFYLEGCPPCAIMDRFVLNRKKVKRALKSCVPVRVDARAQLELSVRYEVYATPTYLVTTPEGEVLARCEGYQSVNDFVAFLGRASLKDPSE